jgi:hypothetical protein
MAQIPPPPFNANIRNTEILVKSERLAPAHYVHESSRRRIEQRRRAHYLFDIAVVEILPPAQLGHDTS